MKTRKYTKYTNKHKREKLGKNKSKKIANRRRRSARHAGAVTKTVSRARSNARSLRADNEPYTLKNKQNKMRQIKKLADELQDTLSKCKDTERLMMTNQSQGITSKTSKHYKRKPDCVHGSRCNRTNPTHFRDFSHPTSSAIIAQPFKMCADKFIELSYKLFETNEGQMPEEWYIIVGNNLRESDYTIYTSLYFNILANLCIHHEDYARDYPNKQFWSHFYTGMEEGAAVTGMYDVTGIPKLSQCLKDMKSVDARYLSNTALLFSKTYGKNDEDDENGEDENDEDENDD